MGGIQSSELRFETKSSSVLSVVGVAASSQAKEGGHRVEPSGCSIAATADVVGDRWSILVLRSIFRGRHRFGELQTELGIAKNLLSNRLRRMVDHGILYKVQYQERPIRYEYRLTTKGADLYEALISLMRWGDRWYSDGDPPTVLVHQDCGSPLDLSVRCEPCNTAVRPSQVASRSGSSATTTQGR